MSTSMPISSSMFNEGGTQRPHCTMLHYECAKMRLQAETKENSYFLAGYGNRGKETRREKTASKQRRVRNAAKGNNHEGHTAMRGGEVAFRADGRCLK